MTECALSPRQKVEHDYDSLQERLKTLPEQLSYDIMVCVLKCMGYKH